VDTQGCERLALSILAEAVKDVQKGSKEALQFLVSDTAINLTDGLGYNSELLILWAMDKGERFRTLPTKPLTVRQMVIIRLMKDGFTCAQIARMLKVSHGTIGCHLQAIRTALRACTHSEIVERARGLNLLP
jgi:DNA-binding NarL/FixJ family response regulator